MTENSLGTSLQDQPRQEVNRAVSPRELIFRYLKYLPWIVICVTLGLVLGYIKIRYSIPIYRVQSSLLIKNDDPMAGGKDDRLGALFLAQSAENLSNEIQLLRSTPVMSRVVKDLDLQTTYYNKGKVKSSLLYSTLPFHLLILHQADSTVSIGISITVRDDRKFLINNGKDTVLFDKPFSYGGNQLMLIRDPSISFQIFQSPDFDISWQPTIQVAWGIIGSLRIVPGDDNSTILQLSMETQDVQMGKDILNTVMGVYDSLIIEDKNRIAVNSKEFIDKSLDTLRQQLGGVEGTLKGFM